MQIAALVFNELTTLDIIGPIEVLARLPDAEIVVVAADRRPLRDARSCWTLVPDATPQDVLHPEVLVVPGGPGVAAVIKDESILDWIRAVDNATAWTTSVCTGAIILAAAGLLTGRRATTHWTSKAELGSYGARVVDERVVQDGKIITAAGVSAGIDMALTLAALIAGDEVAKAIQLLLEYDPKPPFDAGAPSRAQPDTLHRALMLMADAKEERETRVTAHPTETARWRR